MNKEKKAVLRLKNDIKRLFEIKDVKNENGTTTLNGILHGFVPVDCGNGYLIRVGRGNDIVEVLIDVTSAIEGGKLCRKGLPCGINDIDDFEMVEIKGKIIQNQLIADRPYVFMLAETVNGSGVIARDEFKLEDECELVDITISNMRRMALAGKRDELPMDLLISELFTKISENGTKGLIAFTVDNNGKLAMYGKGDLYAKEVQQIARRLLELTKNNNPNYCWSFQ